MLEIKYAEDQEQQEEKNDINLDEISEETIENLSDNKGED